MLYSCARAIGGLAAAADGRVDRIILTGGLAHSHYVTGYLTQKLSFIAPVEVMAGEFELEALAAGASRVLNGQERVGMTLETAKTRMNTGFFARPYCS